MRIETVTHSGDPDAHTPDIREIRSGIEPKTLGERHRIHRSVRLQADGISPVQQTFSQDPNAHSQS